MPTGHCDIVLDQKESTLAIVVNKIVYLTLNEKNRQSIRWTLYLHSTPNGASQIRKCLPQSPSSLSSSSFLSNPFDRHHARLRLRHQNQSPSPHGIVIPEAKVASAFLSCPPSGGLNSNSLFCRQLPSELKGGQNHRRGPLQNAESMSRYTYFSGANADLDRVSRIWLTPCRQNPRNFELARRRCATTQEQQRNATGMHPLQNAV